MIKFYKGDAANYKAESHGTGIYFAEDTKEIFTSDKQSFGKNADQSETTADIVVAGGPLADDITTNWPSEWQKDGNKVIPAGTSIQDILQGLFLKTVNGTVTWGNKSWSPSLGKPTVTLSSDGPIEVGSTVTCKVTSNSTVSSNSRSVTCTCSQGYFNAGADGNPTGSYQSGNKTVSKDGSSTGTVSLSYTWNGEAVSNFVSESTALKVVGGENTFVANQSGITASVDALPTTKVFAATNTKSVLANTSAEMSDTKPADKDLTSNNNDKIVGSYKYFIGQVSGVNKEFNSALVRGLATQGFVCNLSTADVVTTVNVSAGSHTYIVAVPEEYTITQILALGKDAKSAWSTNGEPKTTVDVVLPDNSTKTYNVFYCENVGGADAEFTNLKIGTK